MLTTLTPTNLQDPEAAQHIDAIVRSATAVDGNAPLSDQARMEAANRNRAVTLIHASPSTTAANASPPVGFAVLGEGELDLVIAPEHRGHGHASRALPQLLREERAAVLAWAHGTNPAADHLLSRAGFAPVRTLLRMSLDPAALPAAPAGTAGSAVHGAPVSPSVKFPEGTELSVFSPQDEREWLRVNAAAFAEHPEQGKMTLEDLRARQAEPWFAPEDFLLVRATDGSAELLGFNWLKVERDTAGAVSAEIYAIGVAPEAAGRGLGGALMRAGLARIAEHSPASISLYVEGDNTPALGLYTKLGFTVATRSQQWLRPAIT